MSAVFLRIIYFSIFLQLTLCDLDMIMKTVNYCIRINDAPLSPDYLVGTWYTIHKYVYGAGGSESYCSSTILSAPSKTELDEYKAKYDLSNETFSFDDGAVLSSQNKGRSKGIFVGNKTAKYYFLETETQQKIRKMYDVVTFKRINDEYLIYYRCDLRGHVKFLWSKRNNQTDAELDSVLSGVYELAGRPKERYCKARKVETTTEYF